MKKLLNILILFVALTGSAYAQEATNTAVSAGAVELSKSKVNGAYEFVLPSSITEEKVAESSKYYTHYFSTAFDKKTGTVKITMNQNDAKGRLVIGRFLMACGLSMVKVDDKTMDMTTFMETHF